LETQIPKAIPSKKSNAGGITIPNFKLHYRAIAIKTDGTCTKKKTKTDMKTSGKNTPVDMNPHSCANLIFDKSANKHMKEKRQPLQQMLLGKMVICLQKTETDPCLSPCVSINSKWIKGLNVKPKSLQLVHKRAENTLETIGIGKDFLSRTPAV
jgi:hypothetical protein